MSTLRRSRLVRALLAGLVLVLLPFAGPARAAHRPHDPQAPKVGIVLFDGVEIIDFTGPYEVFGQAGFAVETLSSDGKPVTTAMGLTVTPDRAFADAGAYDLLLVPGGDIGDAMQDRALLDFLRRRSTDTGHLLSVCTGANLLAEAGLLDGLEATTFHQDFDRLQQRHPGITVRRDRRWVDNGRIVTSAGLSSGIDAALHLVAVLRGEEVARSTALHLEYDWHPEHGFVRGLLADRLLPRLQALELPDGTVVDRQLSLGDRAQWQIRYVVTGPLDAADLLARIDRAMRTEADWQPVGSAVPATRWTRREGTTVWQLDYAERPGDDGAVLLTVELGQQRAGATVARR